MMILADVVAVGHTMIEGARDMLVVQITLEAMFRHFFLFFAVSIISCRHLTWYCPDNTAKVVIKLTGNDTGCLTEGWEIVTHLTDKPEA
jgi:hypothetical protein